MKRLMCSVLCILAVVAVHAVMAQEMKASPIVSTLKGFVVQVSPQGEELLQETDKVAPGQVVEYHLTYLNTTDAAIPGLQVIGPVPGQTQYVGASASAIEGRLPEFSVDNAASFMAEPVTYTVTLEDGTTEDRVATPDMYTHVRWSLASLPSEQPQVFTYRVKVK